MDMNLLASSKLLARLLGFLLNVFPYMRDRNEANIRQVAQQSLYLAQAHCGYFVKL